MTADQDALAISSLPHLERLEVVCPISRQGMESLCACRTLHLLSIFFGASDKSVFPTEWLSCLQRFPRLYFLSLPKLSVINEETILCLSRLPFLTSLYIVDYEKLPANMRERLPFHKDMHIF